MFPDKFSEFRIANYGLTCIWTLFAFLFENYVISYLVWPWWSWHLWIMFSWTFRCFISDKVIIKCIIIVLQSSIHEVYFTLLLNASLCCKVVVTKFILHCTVSGQETLSSFQDKRTARTRDWRSFWCSIYKIHFIFVLSTFFNEFL